MQQQHVDIVLGERVYGRGAWRRKDEIFMDGKKIGIISLCSDDRQGFTTSLCTSRRRAGRQIGWCVAQAQHGAAAQAAAPH